MNSFPTNDRRPLWRRVVSDEIPETVTAQIGRNILLRRTALGMLQGELAQQAGMSQAHLSNIEQGKRSLTVEVLAVFANVLDCEMADLLPASRAGKRAA
jgi:transcriptional regulator with XRE-family HTH domain